MSPSLLAAVVITGLLLQLWLHCRELRYRQRQSAEVGTRASDYCRQRLRFTMLGLIVEALFVLLMLTAGLELLQRLLQVAGLSGWPLQWALLLSVLLLLAAVQRAITLLHVWCVERRFGYSRQRLGGFFRDTLVKAGLLLIVGAGMAAAATHLLGIGWQVGWWWLALLWGGFVWTRSWLYPSLIAPLFNRYRPVDDPELVCRVRAIGQLAGIELGPLLMMDGSRRSSHGNAHVTGAGRFRRVVLLDTLNDILQTEEIVAVVGHEAGHLQARHMLRFQLCSLLASTLWIGLFSLIAAWAELAPGVGLALLWLLTPSALLVVKPLFSGMIREFEHEADAFAVACGYGDALARALIKLTRHNGAPEDSDPWFTLVYHSHPGLAERLRNLENKALYQSDAGMNRLPT